MSQGKAWNKDEVLTALEPYFKLGCSVTKACEYAGIAKSTVQTWIDDDETLRLKVKAWMNEPNALARRNWVAKMNEGDFLASKEWAIRREKEDFSERQEVTGADGANLTVQVINYADNASVPVQAERVPDAVPEGDGLRVQEGS